MGFTQSARMLARRHKVDVASLIDILSHCRPYPSKGLDDFVSKYLDGIDGMITDEIGNRYIRVPNADGSASNTLWSCHTDSVHSPKMDGRQNIRWDADGNILGLNEGKPGQCLGADDGAGMWLMLEMLKVGKPGLYIFHTGEERGGVGSRWLVKNTPEVVDGIDFAIAFDRMALSSIITYQGGTRCCSNKFGLALGAELSVIDGLDYKLDEGGTFTDTKMYTDLVAECTNVSVGYYNQHGPRETLDVRHMLRLREALLKLDTSKLPVERKPGDNESRWPSYSYGDYGGYSGYGRSSSTSSTTQQRVADSYRKTWGEDEAYEEWLRENAATRPTAAKSDQATMIRLCKQFPEAVVKILKHFGVDQYDIADVIMGLAGINGSVDGLLEASAKADDDLDLANPGGMFDDDDDDDDVTDTRVHCESCDAMIAPVDIDEDMRCPYCYANVETAFEDALKAQDEATQMALDEQVLERNGVH